ncbi:MAG TPA: DUF1905 domain-containing protein [Pyrinomonadaceae bacterium]|nr:DUF1905 domain-containing protein [Pyrinomonadaceae bacterium]
MAKETDSVVFKAKLEKFYPESGWHYIPVSKKIADRFKLPANNRRVVCTINDRVTFHCALMPNLGNFFVMVNKKIRNELGLEVGDQLKVKLSKDNSKYGMPISKEFVEVLRQDKAGSKMFHKLTPGKQRSLIYMVGKIKDIDRRIFAALTILKHLQENEGKIDYPKLMDELKRPIEI